MKAISLWQPWASLMALGLKENETRSWALSYPGPIAIHAAKKLVKVEDPYIIEALEKYNLTFNELPLGAVLCWFEKQKSVMITLNNVPKYPERAFGDYTPGRYMWKMSGLHVLPKPIKAAGRQGIWNWDGEGKEYNHNKQLSLF